MASQAAGKNPDVEIYPKIENGRITPRDAPRYKASAGGGSLA
jgi:hypothetical protein